MKMRGNPGIGVLTRFACAIGIGIGLASAPAQAVVVCQKISNPKKIKLRPDACTAKETPVAVNDVHTASLSGVPLPDNGGPVAIGSLPLPAGSYFVQAIARTKGIVVELVTCTLTAGAATDTSSRLIDGNGDPHDMVMALAVELPTDGAAELTCAATGGGDPGADVMNATINAQPVNSIVIAP